LDIEVQVGGGESQMRVEVGWERFKIGAGSFITLNIQSCLVWDILYWCRIVLVTFHVVELHEERNLEYGLENVGMRS